MIDPACFLRALEANKGCIITTCKQLQISRHVLYKRMGSDPEFDAEVKDVRARTVEEVERKTFQLALGYTEVTREFALVDGEMREVGRKETEKCDSRNQRFLLALRNPEYNERLVAVRALRDGLLPEAELAKSFLAAQDAIAALMPPLTAEQVALEPSAGGPPSLVDETP